MELFVTGATGLVGTHLVEQLVAEGHDVVGLTRSRSNATHLPDDVTVVEGDLAEKETMRDPMAGVDGVFHVGAWFQVGPGPRNVETAERVNVGGTRNVLELMDELDVSKGVYTSTVGVHPGTSGAVIDETTKPACPTFAVYYRTKWEAHYKVARPMMADGLPLVIVLPSAIYGPGDKPEGSMRGIFQAYLTGDLPALPRESRLSFDFVADTARAHRMAMERGTPGEEYIIASEARPLAEPFHQAESLTGIPAPRAVPAATFAALARIMRLVERVTTPPAGFEPELLSFAAGRQYDVDTRKARRELGLEHRSLEAGLREYLAWELDQLEMDVSIEGDAA